MKRKTCSILRHIPIVNIFVDKYTTIPNFHSSYVRDDSEYYHNTIVPFEKYLMEHPDIQPTRKLFNDFTKNKVKR